MAKPNKVTANATQADDLIKQLNQGNAEGSEISAIPNDEAAANAESGKKLAETPESADAPKTSEKSQDEIKSEKAWEHKFKVLEGKYRSEVPKLQAEIKALNERLQSTPDEAAIRQQILSEQPQTNSQPATTSESASLTQLREEYGPELIDGLLGVMKEQVAPLQKSVNQVAESNVESAKEAKYSILRQKLATQGVNFDEVNASEDFIGWLNSSPEDPYMPTQQQIMGSAFSSNDFDKVAEVFVKYVGSLTNAPSNLQSKSPLENHAEMQSSAAVASSSPTGGQVWTNQSISEFYASKPPAGDKRLAEWNKKEKQLFLAQQQTG
jgi:hypothetical protein